MTFLGMPFCYLERIGIFFDFTDETISTNTKCRCDSRTKSVHFWGHAVLEPVCIPVMLYGKSQNESQPLYLFLFSNREDVMCVLCKCSSKPFEAPDKQASLQVGKSVLTFLPGKVTVCANVYCMQVLHGLKCAWSSYSVSLQCANELRKVKLITTGKMSDASTQSFNSFFFLAIFF